MIFARNIFAGVLGGIGVTLLSVDVQAHELWVSGYTSSAVHRFDETTGAHLGDLGPLMGAQSIRYGPAGLLYICAEESDLVARYDGPVFVDNFVVDDPGTPEDETGGLDAPTAAVFGPDGNLYVASFSGDNVYQYDGATGAFLSEFVSPRDGGLNGPDAGMTFGPDGHLYVPSFNSSQILRYNGETGAFIDVFVGANNGGLQNPRMLLFRGDGSLWVSSWGSNSILRFANDGTFIDRIIRSTRPTGFAFGPHDRNVYVTSDLLNNVRVYDGENGTYLGDHVPNDGTIDGGTWVSFYPDSDVRMSRMDPGQSSQSNEITLKGATPQSLVIFLVGTNLLSQSLPNCRTEVFGVELPKLFFVPTNAQGSLALSGFLGPETQDLEVLFQFIDLASCRVSNLVIQTIE